MPLWLIFCLAFRIIEASTHTCHSLTEPTEFYFNISENFLPLVKGWQNQ